MSTLSLTLKCSKQHQSVYLDAKDRIHLAEHSHHSTVQTLDLGLRYPVWPQLTFQKCTDLWWVSCHTWLLCVACVDAAGHLEWHYKPKPEQLNHTQVL